MEVKRAAFFTRRERSHPQPRATRPLPVRRGGCHWGAREHGEDGEHPPFDRNEHLGTLD